MLWKLASLVWLKKGKQLRWCNIVNGASSGNAWHRLHWTKGRKGGFFSFFFLQNSSKTCCLCGLGPGGDLWFQHYLSLLTPQIAARESNARGKNWKAWGTFYEGGRSSKPGFNNCFPLVSRKWQMVRPPEAWRWEWYCWLKRNMGNNMQLLAARREDGKKKRREEK